MDGHQSGFPPFTNASTATFFQDEQDSQPWQYRHLISGNVHSPLSGTTAYFESYDPNIPRNSTIFDFNIPPHTLPRHETPVFLDDEYHTFQHSSTPHGSNQHDSVPGYPIGLGDEAIVTPQICPDNLRVGPPMKAKIGSDVLVSLTTQRRTRPAQYKCGLCPSDFTTKYNLRNHLKSHYAIRDYRCEGCQQTFGIRHVFKRHQRTCKLCV